MAKIQLNGKKVVIKSNYSIFDLLKKYNLSDKKVAIEYNGKIIQRVNYKKKFLRNNDKIEVVTFIGVVKLKKDIFKVAGNSLGSRLIVGTGKYKNFSETAQAVKASGASMVTVAVRRVNILDKKPILTDYLNPKKIIFLPNTAGCFNSEEALRTLRLAREMGGWKLVKLEVLGDKKLFTQTC